MQHDSWRTKITAVAAMDRPHRLYLKASGIAFRIAAKKLQIETWLLSTAYR